LGIDLAEVDGGLGRPSQYRGRTIDGRPIFLGYDNGRLYIATEDEKHRLGEELISVQIGPMFNGDMLLEQICDLTGITVRGEKPALLDDTWRAVAEKCWVLDWSGKTTYWVRSLQVTEEGGRRLAHELTGAFPGMCILEVDWDYSGNEGKRRYLPRKTISQCRRSALLGFGVDSGRLSQMLGREHVMLSELDDVFAHHLDLQFDWGAEADQSSMVPAAAKCGRNLTMPEMRLQASVETQFTTNDPAGRAYAERLIDVMQGCFSTWVEEIDLGTGESIGAPKQATWYSSDLREWCAASPYRFLSCYTDHRGHGRDIGIRACNAPI